MYTISYSFLDAMYIEEILEYDLSYYAMFHQIGMIDEHVPEFLEWAFGRVVSFDKRNWFYKWNRFHGKHLLLDRTPETVEEWKPLTHLWSRFKGGTLK